MDITRFAGDYEALTELYSETPVAIRRRDRRSGDPVQRWVAMTHGRIVASAVARVRPDDRVFVVFRSTEPGAYAGLANAIARELERPVHVTVDEADAVEIEELLTGGFHVEMVTERFEVGFRVAQELVRRAWIPRGYRIESVTEVDEGKAFELDNALRNLVPGTDGWIGNRLWFRAELESAEFDPSAYLVTVTSDDRYVGLLRLWRNEAGPRLGLIGVLPEHRGRPLAAAMLREGLAAAAGWGHRTFSTEASPGNSHVYPRLARIADRSTGRLLQLRYSPKGPKSDRH